MELSFKLFLTYGKYDIQLLLPQNEQSHYRLQKRTKMFRIYVLYQLHIKLALDNKWVILFSGY